MFFLTLLLTTFGLFAFEKFWPSITVASKNDTEKILKNSFIVEDAVNIDNKNWIRIKHDIEIAYPIEKAKMEVLLLDFESYPKFMPYVKKVTIISKNDNSLILTSKNVIRILEYAYTTEYTMKYEWEIVDGNLAMNWSLVSSDGSLLESAGGCFLDSVNVNGLTYTRIRHRNSSLVRKNFPAQELILRLFGLPEVENIIKSVYRECLKRNNTK